MELIRILVLEKCDKAPWLMSATPSVELKRLQQPWKWIKWIKWISQLLNCRYGQPRIWYQPSKMGIGNWKPPYIPIWCLHRHPVQARPPYLISPYLSQNLAPQPSVIPTVLLVGIRKKWINMTIEPVWSVWSQPQVSTAFWVLCPKYIKTSCYWMQAENSVASHGNTKKMDISDIHGYTIQITTYIACRNWSSFQKEKTSTHWPIELRHQTQKNRRKISHTMPYQYLPDTWGAAVVVSVVTLDRIIPGPGFEKFLRKGSQWNTAIGLRTTNASTALDR